MQLLLLRIPCGRLGGLGWSALIATSERQLLDVGPAELLEPIVAALVAVADLLGRQRHDDVGVDLLLPFLHHFELDVDDLHDSVVDHVVVEVELLVQVVLFFQLVELLGRVLNVVQLALEGQVRVLDDLMDQRTLLSQGSCALFFSLKVPVPGWCFQFSVGIGGDLAATLFIPLTW